LPITYAKHERIALEKHSDYTEKWVQMLIAEDPSIIGLGDVDLLAQERIQRRAGRLDLLLRDVEANRRYEVELQLGATDETHIIAAFCFGCRRQWNLETSSRCPRVQCHKQFYGKLGSILGQRLCQCLALADRLEKQFGVSLMDCHIVVLWDDACCDVRLR
jgi:hypothetical protein